MAFEKVHLSACFGQIDLYFGITFAISEEFIIMYPITSFNFVLAFLSHSFMTVQLFSRIYCLP